MGDIYTVPMIISIATFVLTTHITPGPTNIVLLSSVLTFGYKKTFPFMIANIISYLTMVVFIGLGVGLFLTKHPDIMNALKIIGLAYLCWMAWKIANDSSTPNNNEQTQSKPFTFWQSFIYPWINPKAWIVYTSMISVFVTSSQNSFSQMSVILILIFIALVISTYIWSVGGIILKKFITNIKFIKRFNQTMAILLVVSVIPVLI